MVAVEARAALCRGMREQSRMADHLKALQGFSSKLNRLLQRFEFGPISDTLKLPRLQAWTGFRSAKRI